MSAGSTGSTSGETLRRFVLAILVFGLLGSAAELLLLSHFEDAKQLIPLVLITLTLAVLAWHVADGGAATVKTLQATMWLLVGGGLAGVVLHFRSSMEFQLETK